MNPGTPFILRLNDQGYEAQKQCWQRFYTLVSAGFFRLILHSLAPKFVIITTFVYIIVQL